jgi:hypothetical protein
VELLDALDWLLAVLIVVSATETLIVMTIMTGEGVGAAWPCSPQANRSAHRTSRSAQLEFAAVFLGQVFVGAVSPYLVILLVAFSAPWIAGIATTMLVIGGIVGGLTLGLAVAAGLLSPERVVPAPLTPAASWQPRLVQGSRDLSIPSGAA